MQELEALFKLFDNDKNGTIEASELHRMFEDNGIFIDQKELLEIFNIVDEDRSGTLTLEEFKKFILNPKA